MLAPLAAQDAHAAGPDPAAPFDLEQRRRAHWMWQPRRVVAPPAVRDATWPREPLDRFVLARLEAAGLAPAAAADRATWLRRVCFDLVGLPPTPAELDAFDNDDAPDAYEAVVDRLLASPHFGERWARHWFDLVRYSETLGHEFDYPVANAWRYRDYVIRALNADVPYDRLILEHIAGDRLDEARPNPDGGSDESPIGTAFYWFGDQSHSPVDVRKALADRIDNQIDVLSKTFLGITVACARCHDHKFDAIATSDYYALSGYLKSSRYQLTPLSSVRDDPRWPEVVEARRELRDAVVRDAAEAAGRIADYLLATAELPLAAGDAKARRAQVEATAALESLDPDQLERWLLALDEGPVARDRRHPLHVWRRLVDRRRLEPEADVTDVWLDVGLGRREGAAARRAPREPAPRPDDIEFADFARDPLSAWFAVGDAFARRATARVETLRVGSARTGAQLGAFGAGPARGWAHSGGDSPRLVGTLDSPTFEIDKRYVHVLAVGRESRINVILDGFNLIRAPIYGQLKQLVDADAPRWFTIDVGMWRGHRAYVQLNDLPVADPADPARAGGYAKDGWIAVSRVVFSDQRRPPSPIARDELRGLFPAGWSPRSARDLAARLAAAARAGVRALARDDGAPPQSRLVDWLFRHGLLRTDDAARAVRTEELRARTAALEDELGQPVLIPGMADGTPEDDRVHLRGSHASLGEVVPRRFLLALGGQRPAGRARHSGRLDLARRIADPANPLTARVLVNRLWHHLTGRGLVATVDNFGVLGQPPSHPALLDWLAEDFVRGGWSIKRTIRRIVLSSTYRMSSTPRRADGGPDPREVDPENILLHSMRMRRLEGEVIRDAILTVSGALDPQPFGPSVPIHLTPFMDGRGRPGRSGPLDGDRRRSVYLEVRRNFLSPMFLAYDTPVPFSTVGRRTVSNVPAQALTMLNDPFVHEQAAKWAARTLAADASDAAGRIERMFRAAFARRATGGELDAALALLAGQAAIRGCAPDDVGPWTDLAHTLYNVKEFVFVR